MTNTMRFGFENHHKEFIGIGDEVQLLFTDGTNETGKLETIRSEDQEIVVNGIVYSLDDIKELNHPAN